MNLAELIKISYNANVDYYREVSNALSSGKAYDSLFDNFVVSHSWKISKRVAKEVGNIYWRTGLLLAGLEFGLRNPRRLRAIFAPYRSVQHSYF